jgi:hypothetical protein
VVAAQTAKGESVTDRGFVLQIMPQARYMNLAGHHCIDDHHNDRYLAYAASSRAAAWREAKKFLERRIAEGKLKVKPQEEPK